MGERTFFNFNVAQVKAEAEGTTRDQAASELGSSGTDLADSLRIIGRYPGAFALEQGKGLFRTLLGLEAGSCARRSSSLKPSEGASAWSRPSSMPILRERSRG